MTWLRLNSVAEYKQPSVEMQNAYLTLQSAGFDDAIARHLSTKYSLVSIRQQIAWLPSRKATRNRLGLLRRAIEENWQEPLQPVQASTDALMPLEASSSSSQSSSKPPASFATHFYAGWAGNTGTALAPPSANDVVAAKPYVETLLECGMDAKEVSEWGRRFGAYTCDAEKDNLKVVRSLVYALRTHGDVFFTRIQNQRKQQLRQAREMAKEAHKANYWEDYQKYLRKREAEIQAENAASYALFQADELARRSKFQSGILAKSRLADRMREVFDREEERQQRFLDFFHQAAMPLVLDFWDWDTQKNPEGYANGLAAILP